MDKKLKGIILFYVGGILLMGILLSIFVLIVSNELKKHPIKLPAEIKIEIKKAD